MTREADSVALEAEYWRALLADVLEVNDRIGTVAQHLSAVATAEIRLLHSVSSHSPAFDSLTTATQKAVDQLPHVQDAIERIVKLAEGRYEAIDRELDE
jgi:hypothetical protein